MRNCESKNATQEDRSDEFGSTNVMQMLQSQLKFVRFAALECSLKPFKIPLEDLRFFLMSLSS